MKYKVAALLLIGIAATQPAWAEIGRVKRTLGIALVQRGAARLPAAPGLQLQKGDTLITGKDGRMALTFIDNTRFALGPNSRVSVNEYLFDRRTQRGQFLTQVNRGSLAVVSGQIAKSDRDAMKVRTPTSLLGVRGTRFVVAVP
ncbi:MAG TPA: FecR domain-containing protein [Allosphingosinicella sp.]|jgi:hypothetical protein|uniref:FecR family protein n=1 Tax=Allosphingosinicella sp. TaxID=2823234 RepID=UPI002F275D2A